MYFETVLGDLLIIASIFLVKDPPQGLVYNEIGEMICCKQESFSLFTPLPAARLAHGTQPAPA